MYLTCLKLNLIEYVLLNLLSIKGLYYSEFCILFMFFTREI